MTLNHYEVVKPDHPLYSTVNCFMKTLTLSNPDGSSISFVAKMKDWNVHFIRHKRRRAYVLGNKYMVTISHVQECVPKWTRAINDELFNVTPKLFNVSHTEIEVWVYMYLH